MKRITAIWLLLAALFTGPFITAACAQDSGQPDASTLLADAKQNMPVEMPDFGIFTWLDAQTTNYYTEYSNWTGNSSNSISSGAESDILMLRFDILNTTTTPINYAPKIKDIKLQFREKYVFEGYVRQCNYDSIGGQSPREAGISMTINTLYVGHYVLVFMLPNVVFSDKDSPLKVSFTLGEYSVVCNLDK